MRKLDEAVWVRWRHRAEEEKRDARKTDADLAAEVADLVGYDISRGLVNAWFRGRRTPSLVEFMGLCTALGADPGYILLNVRLAFKRLPGTPEMAEAMRERAPSPPYLSKPAKRLKRAKAAKPKVRV